MALEKAITISYDLHPPDIVVAPNLNTTNTLYLAIPERAGEGRAKEYYDTLRTTLATSKETIGKDLTEWRDAVGKGEAGKETRNVSKSEEDEEGET
jgi:hypothetical protein